MTRAFDAALNAVVAAHPSLAHAEVFESLPSTNTYLLDAEPPAPGRAHAVLAVHQTAGRGRHGRRWVAPEASGLCLSVAFHYDSAPEHPAALTLALGVAALEALESLGLGDVMLKWPNDLVWQDRKLGGILTESTSTGSGLHLVTGIGINFRLPDGFSLDASAAPWARGVVDLATARVGFDLPTLAATVLDRFVTTLDHYGPGLLAHTIEQVNAHHWLWERAATLDGEAVRCGAVQSDGRLQVFDALTGAERLVDSGELTPLTWSAA